MSYLVLARKWRPQTFEEVTGQEHVVQTLANAIARDRVAHAFLLCGPRGVGKTTTARLLARALNCVNGPTATPCGECLPCQEITKGSSVDVAEIDGASNNGVDNIRELRETARYLPQRDRHKIFIIDEVHMLSTGAFNALLKTLEEPPPHVKFIFATTDPQKLPETILSRCQRHNFRRLTLPKMVERLRTIGDGEGIRISDHALELIARQADGGMRDSLSLLDQLISSVGLEVSDEAVVEALGLVDRTTVLAIAEALVARDAKVVLEQIASVHDRGVELKKLCEELAFTFRDLLVVKATGEAPADRSDGERKQLTVLAGKADQAQLTRIFDLVHGAIRDVSYAAQPRLALEVALLTAVNLAPSRGLAELAARLEALAASLGAGGMTVGAAPAGGHAAPGRAPPQRSAPPRAGNAPPPPGDDLVARVAAMAKSRSAPREAAARPAKPAAPSGDDDEKRRPQAFLDDGDAWRKAIDGVRVKRPMLALHLAEGRLLSVQPGEVALGFTPEKQFHRSQVEGDLREAEERLSEFFGRSTRLILRAADADAPNSIAQDQREAREERAKRLRAQAESSPAVRAVQEILGGKIDEIRVLEEE